jgi:RHS repeat-associated protein
VTDKSQTVGSVTKAVSYGYTSGNLTSLTTRVKKSGGAAGTVLYWYDEAGHLLGEYDGSGNLIQETVWLGDIPVATLRPGSPVAIYYVHTDHLNTPRKVSRPSDNALLWRWDSDPFGTTAPNENPQSLGTFHYNLRFPGQYFDSESGLSYNYFRDYDSAIGRYVESDPMGLRGGINTYGYVENRPLIAIDPSGRFPTAIYGQWCGPDWTGGFITEFNKLTAAQRRSVKQPVDAVDAACEKHDKCYAHCREWNRCSPNERVFCFSECDLDLVAATYSRGFWGYVIGRFFWNREPVPEKNAAGCLKCGDQ